MPETDVRFAAVMDQVNTASINMPSICPVCCAKVRMQDAFLVCPNLKCPAKVVGTIRKFVTAMDIKNVGDATIEGLVKLGHVKCPADLYTLTLAQFSQVERKGAAHFEKMKAGLDARKIVSLEKFFGALNIPRVGEGSFTNLVLAGFDTFDKMLQITVLQAMTAARVGHDAAEALVQYIQANAEDIIRLRLCLTIQTKQGKKLAGKSFLATGTMSRPRNDIYADIEAAGGMVAKSVTSSLTYLVAAASDSNSSKSQKARQLGTTVISEAQLMEMFKS